MFSHAPADYLCPFCIVVSGRDNPAPYAGQADVVLRTGQATAFVSSSWWPNNPGHVLVVPDAHVENMYDLTPELGAQVLDAARRIALAFKAVYRCAGVSTRQHNEPAGNQDVWHYHVHVFPRWHDDGLYSSEGATADSAELRHRADALRAAWPSSSPK